MTKHVIIDRRKNDKGKSSVNRQRFLGRVNRQVREAVKDTIRSGNIKDLSSSKGKKIKVPLKDLDEPSFNHGEGGVFDHVLPGNKKFVSGDRVNRPSNEGGGGGGGKKGAADGEGDDEFSFHLTKEEFLDIFFEDLALPDLLKKEIASTEEFENHRAGFTQSGSPSRLNVPRSMKQAKSRRLALRSTKKKAMRLLEEELKQLELTIQSRQANGEDVSSEEEQAKIIREKITHLKKKIKAVPFIDEVDLRYNLWQKYPVPTTQAVMFCIMDVSGSMGEWEKEMAKRFFMLLYLFLTRKYERVDLVFIRHHTQPKEVDEQEFFYSAESGGTIISPALELMRQIVDERYPLNQWNIYASQASDGENWSDDCELSREVLINKIMPITQYFAYIEVDRNSTDRESEMWPYYEDVKAQFTNFAMSKITDQVDIYPVFKNLFDAKKKAIS
jgi:hypothetical protein